VLGILPWNENKKGKCEKATQTWMRKAGLDYVLIDTQAERQKLV
jgi:hypothetical protein